MGEYHTIDQHRTNVSCNRIKA